MVLSLSARLDTPSTGADSLEFEVVMGGAWDEACSSGVSVP